MQPSRSSRVMWQTVLLKCSSSECSGSLSALSAVEVAALHRALWSYCVLRLSCCVILFCLIGCGAAMRSIRRILLPVWWNPIENGCTKCCKKATTLAIESHINKGFGVTRDLPVGNGTHYCVHGSKSKCRLSRSWSLMHHNTTGYHTHHTTGPMVVQRTRWLYLSQATRWHDAMSLAHSKDCRWQANHVPFAVAYCEFTKLSADNPFGFTCTVSLFPNISGVLQVCAGPQRVQCTVSRKMRIVWQCSLMCQLSRIPVQCQGAADDYTCNGFTRPSYPNHFSPLDLLDFRLCIQQLCEDMFHFHVTPVPMRERDINYFSYSAIICLILGGKLKVKVSQPTKIRGAVDSSATLRIWKYFFAFHQLYKVYKVKAKSTK